MILSIANKQDGTPGDPSWNFNKWLIGRDGHVRKRYDATFDLDKLSSDIEEALLEEAPKLS